MPGGWSMEMTWMRMPGQSRLGAATMFVGMWAAMMVAMMLPSSLPLLLLYRRALCFRRETHVNALVWAMAAAYFLVWTLFGVTAYAIGVTIAEAAMRSSTISHVIPITAGGGLIIAGAYQFTPWKSACLNHCRDPFDLIAHHLDSGWTGAVRLGAHHGVFCTGCCWALMLMQLVMGVMSLGAMIAIATVIALEKLLARGEVIVRAVGSVSIAYGLLILFRALS